MTGVGGAVLLFVDGEGQQTHSSRSFTVVIGPLCLCCLLRESLNLEQQAQDVFGMKDNIVALTVL